MISRAKLRNICRNAVRDVIQNNPMPRGARCSAKTLAELEQERQSLHDYRITRLKQAIKDDRKKGKDTTIWEELLQEQLERDQEDVN